MNFPYKDDKDLAAIERLPNTAYAEDDIPFIHTERYSLSPDYEPSDVAAKRRLDTQSAMENLWWYEHNKRRTVACA